MVVGRVGLEPMTTRWWVVKQGETKRAVLSRLGVGNSGKNMEAPLASISRFEWGPVDRKENGERMTYQLLENGDLLDAEFSVQIVDPRRFEVTLESRGGSTGGAPVRNEDYSYALRLVLERFGSADMTLLDCRVESAVTSKLPVDERRVQLDPPLAYPVELAQVSDFDALRLEISRGQAPVGRASSSKGGGNGTRRLLMVIEGPQSLAEEDLVHVLQAQEVVSRSRQRRDLAEGLTAELVQQALSEWSEVGASDFHDKYGTRRAAKYVLRDEDGNLYDAKAILFAARSYVSTDEAKSADFLGNRITVAEPLERLGFIVEELGSQGSDGPLPEKPSAEVAQELRLMLEEDDSRLGDVYRLLSDGLSPQEIATELGVSTHNFVSNYSSILGAVLDGKFPKGPSLLAQIASKLRSLLKNDDLSDDTQDYLQRQLAAIAALVDDPELARASTEQAQARTEQAESTGTIGVYVYVLPHYLRHPTDIESGRTLFKVGHSNSDVIRRFRDQKRTTALPEEPILMRIYETGSKDSHAMEQKFHKAITSAGHYRPSSQTAGREWFETDLDFLDQLASLADLNIQVVS